VNELIVSYSGVRGVWGESLTSEVARRYGHAFGRMVVKRHGIGGTLLIGRDTRASGPALLEAMIDGLAPHGLRFIDLGIVPTPTLQFAMKPFAAAGAVVITASHNPRQWNGFKFFFGPDNTVLDAAETRELMETISGLDRLPDSFERPEVMDAHAEAVRLHLEKVLEQVDGERIRDRHFRVAIDSARGAGAEPTPRLLERLGCEVVPVLSSRESEPIPENLTELRQAVRDRRCDLAFAQDLDADRLALVTEQGLAPGEELTLVLVLDHLLKRFGEGSRLVVKNAVTTRAVDELAARFGATLVETRVGEVNLSRALLKAVREGHTAFGGEGNGGVIFPAVGLGRDSLLGIAMVLERLSQDARPLSAHLAELPRYAMVKEKAQFDPTLDLEALYRRVAEAFPGGVENRLDGIRVRFRDGTWVGVRPSNTEPIVRLIAESPSASWAQEAVERLRSLTDSVRNR
jgi:phosphomannomutase